MKEKVYIQFSLLLSLNLSRGTNFDSRVTKTYYFSTKFFFIILNEQYKDRTQYLIILWQVVEKLFNFAHE